MTERETFACLENEYCLWRQSVVFQLLRKAVFIQREIFPSCSIIFCLWRAFKLFRKAVFTQRLRRLRCAFQIFRKKVFPLQLLSRKQWTKHRKPLLNRLWLLLSQTRRERCIGRNKWGRVPISKLSSCRLQGRGGSRRRGKNAEQHRNNSRKAPSSSPPYSSSDAFVVPGLNVFLRGLDGQTRPVAGLTGDSTLSDLNNALILPGQSNNNFILLYRGRLVHNDPRIQLGIFLTTGESGDHLFVQCADELGGGFFDFDLLNTCDHINEETTRERALVLLGGIGRMLKDDAESTSIWNRTLRNLKVFVNPDSGIEFLQQELSYLEQSSASQPAHGSNSSEHGALSQCTYGMGTTQQTPINTAPWRRQFSASQPAHGSNFSEHGALSQCANGMRTWSQCAYGMGTTQQTPIPWSACALTMYRPGVSSTNVVQKKHNAVNHARTVNNFVEKGIWLRNICDALKQETSSNSVVYLTHFFGKGEKHPKKVREYITEYFSSINGVLCAVSTSESISVAGLYSAIWNCTFEEKYFGFRHQNCKCFNTMGRKKQFKLLATVTQTLVVSSGEPFEILQNVCGSVVATDEEAEAGADRAILQRADSTEIVDFLAEPIERQQEQEGLESEFQQETITTTEQQEGLESGFQQETITTTEQQGDLDVLVDVGLQWTQNPHFECNHQVQITKKVHGLKQMLICKQCRKGACAICWTVSELFFLEFFTKISRCPNCCADYDTELVGALEQFANHIENLIVNKKIHSPKFLGLCNAFCQVLVDAPSQGFYSLPAIFEEKLQTILNLWISPQERMTPPKGPPPVNPWCALLLPQVPVEWNLPLAMLDCKSMRGPVRSPNFIQIGKWIQLVRLVLVVLMFEVDDDHPTIHLVTGALLAINQESSVELHIVDVTQHQSVGKEGGPCDMLKKALGDRYHSNRNELKTNAHARKILENVTRLIKNLNTAILIAIGFFQSEGEILRSILQSNTKPAPIVVQYLSHAGTTACADYFVVDGVAVLDSHRDMYSEHLLKLTSCCFQCNSMKLLYKEVPSISEANPEVAKESFGLPTKGILIGNMSSWNRFDVPFLKSCFSILCKIRGSFLVLLKPEQSAMNRMKKFAAQEGCADRIIFVEVIPDSNQDFFRRAHLLDFFLDSWVYNGHTMTVKLLWNRCIVLTLAGNTLSKRTGAALLTAYGATHCIFHSVDRLETFAVQLGNDQDVLQREKEFFRKLHEKTNLFDMQLFAKGFLNVLEQAWRKWKVDQSYIDIIETSTEITSSEPQTDARSNEPERIEGQREDFIRFESTLVSKITSFLNKDDFAPAENLLHYLNSNQNFSHISFRYQGSSFLLLNAVHEYQNVVLKVCLSKDRAERESGFFTLEQKQTFHSQGFAISSGYELEYNVATVTLYIFVVMEMKYEILDLFKDLAKKQKKPEEDPQEIITLMYQVLNFFHGVYQGTTVNSLVFDPKKLMLRVLSGDESKENAVNFRGDECAFVVVCAPEEPILVQVPVSQRQALRRRSMCHIVQKGTTAMQKSLQLVFEVFVEILRGQVLMGQSEANSFKSEDSNHRATMSLFEHIHERTDPRVLENFLGITENAKHICARDVFTHFASHVSCVSYKMHTQYQNLLALLIKIQSNSFCGVEDVLKDPLFNPLRTQEVGTKRKRADAKCPDSKKRNKEAYEFLNQ